MCDNEGKPIKVRGKKNVAQYLKDNPAVWKELYDKCEDKLKQKEDPFIKSFEEMMNVNVYEKIGVDGNTNLEEM